MVYIIHLYNYLFHESADPRTQEWWLFGGPMGITTIIVTYLYTVYGWLPKFMQDRKPYKLKRIIQIYDIVQLISCTYLVYMLLTAGWLTTYSWICEPIDYSNDPMALRALHACYWTFVLKMLELLETVFFVLRKKNNQITLLHTYHHVSTLLVGWGGTKYIGGGMPTFPVMLNCLVHIPMYAYYFLTSMGPFMQKKMAPMKSKLTTIQLVQFLLMIAQTSITLRDDCSTPNLLAYLFIPDIAILFVLFSKFYIQSYIKKHKGK